MAVKEVSGVVKAKKQWVPGKLQKYGVTVMLVKLYIVEQLHICLHFTLPVPLGLFQGATVVCNKQNAAL